VTFSESTIVKYAQENFVPAWESVSDVTTAIYDLGNGKEVKATMNGEIAVYFCRPDGKVFDVLPALQSPKVTYEAMQRAYKFYQETGATDRAIRKYHEEKLEALVTATGSTDVRRDVKAWQELAKARLEKPGQLTIEKSTTSPMKKGVEPVPTLVLRDPKAMAGLGMNDMAAKAVVVPQAAPPILIIQPRGIDTFAAELHAALSMEEPKAPSIWKKYIFEDLLGQSLEGGKTVRFDINSDEGSLSVIQ
jgi:hypothetical protein